MKGTSLTTPSPLLKLPTGSPSKAPQMGSRPPPTTSLSCCCLLLLLVVFFHPPACQGYRLRGSAAVAYAPPAPGEYGLEAHRRRPVTSFALPEGREFDYLPRGLLIPPSAPSKRHNSVLDSAGGTP